MNRRCTSDACISDAVAKSTSLDLPVATILYRPDIEWQRLAYGNGVRVAARRIPVDWKKFPLDEFLFVHASIVCSVEVEDNGYYIKPACSELVNNNGNAWTNQVLKATFKTFIGGDSFVEHVQQKELSKGKILDAILRPVRFKSSKGEEADIYFVDILVAVNRKHSELVRQIESGEMNTLSMGTLATFVTCSKCGKVFGDNDGNCEHIRNELLSTFVDEHGIERKVAELCGRMIKKNGVWVGDPNSNKFIEASWVAKPAFEGAVLNHFVLDPPKRAKKMLAMNTERLRSEVEDLFRLRVADVPGMVALRVARDELLRRRREDLVSRVVARFVGGRQ